ncbi:DUF3039 domain-containing protein [Georgenia sp. Z1491]|uniref:DUF3039 domain-containing protein n=1 Tax=Georgenia sp. Z1491 TaxID=3416707 RepID=UPI003CF0256E
MSSIPDENQPHAAPAGPATSTDVLERTETEHEERLDAGDAERYAHYVRKDKVEAGRPVIALCGKVWTPGRDPKKFPVCPTCKEIYEGLGGGEGSGGGRRGWPFGRGRGE